MTAVDDTRFQQCQNLPEFQKAILRFKALLCFKVQEKTISNCLSQLPYLTMVQENSAKGMNILLAGGDLSSPDFAEGIILKNRQQHLNLIMEAKDQEKSDPFSTEQQKTTTTQEFFKQLNPNVTIRVEAQYRGQKNKEPDPFWSSRERSMTQNERF
jgi:hypothetical protein